MPMPELGRIYCGDSLEIMKTWPDNCVDLVITDPPYGMNYKSNYYKYGNPHAEIAGDDAFPLEALKEMFRIARGGVFSFCRRNLFPIEMWDSGTVLVTIKLIGGFELFNTRPYHNYETWSNGYTVENEDVSVSREDLDDAVNAFADALKTFRAAKAKQVLSK